MAEFFYTTKLIQHVLMNRRRKRVSFVLSKVDTIPGRLVLDIGCGRNGRSFEDFVSRDLKIVGVDILDEDKINMNHPDFTYFKQNAENLAGSRTRQVNSVGALLLYPHSPLCSS